MTDKIIAFSFIFLYVAYQLTPWLINQIKNRRRHKEIEEKEFILEEKIYNLKNS